MEVLVLAGGKGTRLGNLTADKPKALVPVNGKPIMDYIITALMASTNVDRILLDVNAEYKKLYIDRYGPGTDKTQIDYISSNAPDTAEAVQRDLAEIKGNAFMLIMGDLVFDMNVGVAIDYYNLYKGKYNVIVAVPYDYENLACEIKGKFITKLYTTKKRSFVAGGVYIFNKEDINGRMKENFDSVLPILVKEQKLIAYKYFGYMKGINTYKELMEVEKDIMENKLNASWIG